MRSTQGNEELIKPRMFTCESIPSVCLRDNNGSHKETWGGAGLAGVLVLSFIASFLLLAPVVYFPTASLLFVIFIFFSYSSSTKDTCQRASTAPNLSLLFENANSFYLRPAPVTKCVSELWDGLAVSYWCALAVVHLPLWHSCLSLRPW